MYISRNKLSHLLQPDHYRDAEFYETEQRKLFDPAWHMIGAIDEIPNPGDFFTTEFLGRPLLIRNCEGEIHCFLNVCGHRHCRITDKKAGNAPQIRCQYHGWEFKTNGSTGKIPDAQCFRPFDRENTKLQKFRTAICGNLIFIALSDAAPSFDEYIGKHKEIIDDWFGPEKYHFGKRMTYELKANWKVSTENTLESYHVPHVHRKTIVDHPDEKDQDHEVGSYYSSLFTSEPDSINIKIQDILLRMLGVKPNHQYTHHLIYPNTMMIGLDPMTMIQNFIPTSPTTHRWEGLVFTRSAAHPAAKLFQSLSDPLIKLGTKRVVEEDIHIFPEVQRGLDVSNYPGVIGTIEERIFAFQEFILEKCEGREQTVSKSWQSESEQQHHSKEVSC